MNDTISLCNCALKAQPQCKLDGLAATEHLLPTGTCETLNHEIRDKLQPAQTTSGKEISGLTPFFPAQ